jgi:hypothetical protein
MVLAKNYLNSGGQRPLTGVRNPPAASWAAGPTPCAETISGRGFLAARLDGRYFMRADWLVLGAAVCVDADRAGRAS